MKHKYKYYRANNKIICVSTFAGKPVRGVAVCSPNDNFDYDKGAELARLRCDVKIANKRCMRAAKKLTEANNRFTEAQQYWDRMKDYLLDSYEARHRANSALAMLESELIDDD